MQTGGDKTWSTGEGNGKPLQYSCLEKPMNSMKRQKYRTLKDELPKSVGAQYATRDQWRNNSRKNEEMEPRQKQQSVDQHFILTHFHKYLAWVKLHNRKHHFKGGRLDPF